MNFKLLFFMHLYNEIIILNKRNSFKYNNKTIIIYINFFTLFILLFIIS